MKEVEKLRKVCEECEGDTQKATQKCTPRIPAITAGEFRRALGLFLEQSPDSAFHVDIKKLQER